MGNLSKIYKTGLTIIASGYAVLVVVYLALRVLVGDGVWWLSLANTFAYVMFAPLVVLLPLVALTRARLTTLRLLPLALVGLVWFGGYFLPKPYTAPNGDSIDVLSLNVWGNNHDLSAIVGWIREVNADIVILQEVSPAYADELLAGLSDVYPSYITQADESRWGGNFTLTRYTIISQEYIDLKIENNPFPARLVLDIEGQAVAVYNVHLAWPVGEPRLSPPIDNLYWRVALGFDDRIRNLQIERLLEHLDTEPYPYIVAGDFNTSDHSVTYQKLAAAMRDSFREVGVGLGGSWPVSAARGLPGFVPPLIRIDYIWHSDALRTVAAWQGEAVGSDHLPLHAVLEVRTGGKQS